MLTNIRYILITALRDWLFIGLFGFIIVASVISAILGSTSFIEEQEMTLSYAAGSSRIILMLGVIIFTCFHIRSAFDSKEIDVILSRPISRTNIILAYWLGFTFVGLLLVFPTIIVIALIGVKSWAGFFIWSLSLALEMALVIALALFSAFTLRSAVASVMACMGIYVLSRMMAFFVITAESPAFAQSKLVIFKYILQFISTIVPRLDFFTKSQWLIYSIDSSRDWQLFVAQALIFVPLLLLAAIADFRRKQF